MLCVNNHVAKGCYMVLHAGYKSMEPLFHVPEAFFRRKNRY